MNDVDAIAACAIRLGDRPLIVCDVDDVVLEFITPFIVFLEERGLVLKTDSFRLTGNIVPADGGEALDRAAVKALTAAFFAEQDRWQGAVEEATQTLAALSNQADIVFLTAMPPAHHSLRRRVLDAAGMPYPMIATEAAKGPEVARLHAARPLPLVFLDDIFINLHSVREHAPEALLINLMARHALAVHAPHPGDGVSIASDWRHAERLILDHFGH